MALHVTIERIQPLTGSVTCGACEAVRFTGWLELLGVLSDLVEAAGTPSEDRRREA